MHRTPSNLGPVLWMTGALLAASVLAKSAPRAAWAGVAALLVLVLSLLGADVLQRRRAGRHPLPSPDALIVAAILLAAGGILASSGPDRLAEMIPILGSCAALPILLRRERARASCWRI